MVYVIGIVGFICGFVLGVWVLGRLLKGRSPEELLNDRGLKFTYGLLAWAIAGLTSYCAVALYKYYFPVLG